jgi:hypothetical protein
MLCVQVAFFNHKLAEPAISGKLTRNVAARRIQPNNEQDNLNYWFYDPPPLASAAMAADSAPESTAALTIAVISRGCTGGLK